MTSVIFKTVLSIWNGCAKLFRNCQPKSEQTIGEKSEQ